MKKNTDDVDVEGAVCDGVTAGITCRAEDAMSAQSEAVIGRRRRVAIVTTGVREGAQTVSAAEADQWFGNERGHLRGLVNQATSACRRLLQGRTLFNLRRHHFCHA